MKKKILNSEILNRSLKNIKINDREIFKHEIYKKISPSYLYTLNNIKVFSNGYLGIFFNIKVICDFLKINSISRFKYLKLIILFIYYFFNLIKFFFIPEKQVKIECAYIIHDRHSQNYFHWVCDVLPKICLNKKKFNTKCPLILPKFKTKFQKESLNLLGVEYIEIQSNKTFFINKVFYISELYPSGNPRPKVFKNFKQKILEKIYPNLKKKRKIYISRKFAQRRKLINEHDLETKLKKMGFEIHNFENYTFSKQVRLSAESKIIIGLNGAGLINFMWMSPKSKVIDIRPKDKSLNAFFGISDIFDIRYCYYWSKFEKFSFKNVTHSNYIIDISHFLKNNFNKF